MSTCSEQRFWPPTWKSPMTPSPSVEVVSAARILASVETHCEFQPLEHGLRAGHREQPIAWHSLCRSKTIVLSLVHLVRNGRLVLSVSRTAWLSPGRIHLCLLSDVTWPLRPKGNNPEGRSGVNRVCFFSPRARWLRTCLRYGRLSRDRNVAKLCSTVWVYSND